MATLDRSNAPGALRDFLAAAAAEIDTALEERLPSLEDFEEGDAAYRLAEAMRYAVLGGGKRLRPAIVLAAARAIDPEADVLGAACAIELLHAYTLVHDDLPAMDNDSVRRGQPTVHKKFGEAIGILTGDALLTDAFSCLAELGPRCAAGVTALARAAGATELLAGQARDLDTTRSAPQTIEEAEKVHLGKTGALFGAAAELGAISAAASADVIRGLRDYGLALGVAFQHADDLDDGEHSALAKHAKRRRLELADEAIAALAPLEEGAPLLTELARWVGGA